MVFAGAFESDFGFTLKERRSSTLDQIHTDALEIEPNLYVVGNIKAKYNIGDKKKGKEELKTASQLKYSHEHSLMR